MKKEGIEGRKEEGREQQKGRGGNGREVLIGREG